MRPVRWSAASSLLISLLVATAAIGASPAHTQARSSGNPLVWGTVPSPNHGNLASALLGVSAVSATDIWGVGEYNPGVPPTATGRRTLTEHWNGQTWTIVPSPNATFPNVSASHLTSVDAVTTNNVWAVGYGEDFSSSKSETLILHWNGTTWITVASPNPGGAANPNQLYAVGGVAASDVWAVGAAGYPERALTLHWNGSSWAAVANRCAAPLSGVVALSAHDVWAVGNATSCHYNGSSWVPVPIALPADQSEPLLLAVSASSASDVWAAGDRLFACGESVCDAPLVEHWNGSTWTAMTAVPGIVLNGVAALAANNVFVVGTDQTYGVVGHWDGRTWTTVPSPRVGSGGLLQAIAAVPAANKLWAVGSSYSGAGSTLIEAAPSTTQGTLTGATGVSGATVSWFGSVKGSTTTDVFGNYAVAGLPAGAYTVVASYTGCTPDSATIRITAGVVVTHDFHLGGC
jgi:hypothetical protein